MIRDNVTCFVDVTVGFANVGVTLEDGPDHWDIILYQRETRKSEEPDTNDMVRLVFVSREARDDVVQRFASATDMLVHVYRDSLELEPFVDTHKDLVPMQSILLKRG